MSNDRQEEKVGRVGISYPYRQVCKSYALGMAGGATATATVVAALILFLSPGWPVLRGLFLFNAVAGFGLVAVAYLRPIWFHELLEDRPKEVAEYAER